MSWVRMVRPSEDAARPRARGPIPQGDGAGRRIHDRAQGGGRPGVATVPGLAAGYVASDTAPAAPKTVG